MIVVLVAVFGCAGRHVDVTDRQPFSVDVSGPDIIFRGAISREAVEHLTDRMKSLPYLKRLVITSGGGDVEAGIQLGLLVHERGLDVYVPSLCGSSCANYVFTAGNRKILAATAFLMWHGGATQEGLGDPPPCTEGSWYEDLFDCDAEDYKNKIDDVLDRLLEKEAQFFEVVGVDQRITTFGQDSRLQCSEEKLSGWYYSIADMEKLGVRGIEVVGGPWLPVSPDEKVRVCQVDLSAEL